MGDNKRDQERAELHRTIWGMANDLRGSVDGCDFKQYVLGMIFYRYISEVFAKFIDDGEHEAGDTSFSYGNAVLLKWMVFTTVPLRMRFTSPRVRNIVLQMIMRVKMLEAKRGVIERIGFC